MSYFCQNIIGPKLPRPLNCQVMLFPDPLKSQQSHKMTFEVDLLFEDAPTTLGQPITLLHKQRDGVGRVVAPPRGQRCCCNIMLLYRMLWKEAAFFNSTVYS